MKKNIIKNVAKNFVSVGTALAFASIITPIMYNEFSSIHAKIDEINEKLGQRMTKDEMSEMLEMFRKEDPTRYRNREDIDRIKKEKEDLEYKIAILWDKKKKEENAEEVRKIYATKMNT